MIRVSFKPTFVRQMNKIEKNLAEEVFEKIELFKNEKNHKQLKVHKLHGKLSGCFSFSVNYRARIVFEYEFKKNTVFLAIGDHDMYA